MTAAELIRSARSRAGLAQHELARLLDTPRSQIGRWESGEVEPAFATVRRVLRACGFDLSMALVPFDPDAPQVARLVELSRLTPKERLDAALVRGGSEQTTTHSTRTPSSTARRAADRVHPCRLPRSRPSRADEVPAEVDLVIPKAARLREREAILTFAIRARRRRSGRRRVVLPAARGNSPGTEVPEGTRGPATCAGAPNVSTSVAASVHGSPPPGDLVQ